MTSNSSTMVIQFGDGTSVTASDPVMAPIVETFVDGFHDTVAVEKMNYNRLGNTELLVSELSLGGGGFGGLYGEYDRDGAIQAIDLALRSGVNLIDTSPWYGQGRSEQLIGEAVRDIPRQAFYMADKVGRYELEPARMFDFRPERVRLSVEHSLQLLGLSRIDLLQVHDLEFCADLETIVSETLPALDELRQQGLVRYVGITDAGATSMGLLSPVDPPDWHPASEKLKQACREMKQLCKSRGFDLTRLALHYFLTRPGVTSHLMGVTSPEQVRQDLEMSREPISAEETVMLREVLDRFASLPAEIRHWEATSTDNYWEAINKAKGKNKLSV
ncbi:L-galactose dehydrogenase [Amphibalanus amphitrite]|uniref:L-galactose dehydrogenase n=2 Tax=Amphibalanus amphitrite TaxID=1232801 RepID=A0A6A4VW14_AMPAM|nr:L-galactose dehydrogenase [Amphibalanus amphitrite]